MRKRRAVVLSISTITIISISLLIIRLLQPLGAMSEALERLASNPNYRFSSEKYLTFVPESANSDVVGVIIYPGGLVPPEAYAPLCATIATAGYLCTITPMPLNLAVLNTQAALDVMADYRHVVRWVLVGHSLGGAMAARFVDQSPGAVDTLLLMGAYADVDITDDITNVWVFDGSEDKIRNASQADLNRVNLPESTNYVEIKGGNHAGFGWYGEQAGDGVAKISREAQQQIVVETVLNLLR